MINRKWLVRLETSRLSGFTEDRTPTHQRVRGGDGGVCLAAGELASRSQLDEASARPPPGAPASIQNA
jgi:hypothetical protein